MNIIDSVIDTEKTRRNVRIMLPIMIHWAKTGQTNHTYDELIKALGYKRFSGIGYPLGRIQDVIDKLKSTSSKEIPTLNTMVKKTPDGLPSYGFEYVERQYADCNQLEKRELVALCDNRACSYMNWDCVLKELQLTPYKPFSDEELPKISLPNNYHGGGEGPEHKKLKEYICNHPSVVGIKEDCKGITEETLFSGDRLDVLFKLKNGDRIAVEVKPSGSNDEDILRGIYQCVKYKAVMEAMRKAKSEKYNIKVILVTARSLSHLHQRLISEFSTHHIHFKKKLV